MSPFYFLDHTLDIGVGILDGSHIGVDLVDGSYYRCVISAEYKAHDQGNKGLNFSNILLFKC